jgi:integrase
MGARSTRRVGVTEVTVEDAANLYLEQLCQRAEAKQVSWGHYRSMRQRLRRLVVVVGGETRLAEVGRTELERVALTFAKRPACLMRKYQKVPPGRPMSLATAKDYIAGFRAFFVWVDEHPELPWERPKGFERVFRLKERHMKTQEESARDAAEMVTGEVATYSMDELTRLFRAGRTRDRLYILLGLNCGFTSIEISTLRTFEVFLDAADPYIHRRRHKTGVEAKWLLWPETVTLLRRHRAPDNAHRSWLLTREGNELVEDTRECRKDAIDQAWTALWPRSGLPGWRGHRFLRKTGANAVKKLGGLEESEMYLAHQEPGLNKHYANRNWEKMWACLDRYRAQLPFLGLAWDLDPEECLFTQAGNPAWEDINPPHVQRVNKRSRTRLLNVSLNAEKGMFYARVYERGRTYSRGYFAKAEDAAAAAAQIRRLLNRGLDPRLHLPATLRGQRGPASVPRSSPRSATKG